MKVFGDSVQTASEFIPVHAPMASPSIARISTENWSTEYSGIRGYIFSANKSRLMLHCCPEMRVASRGGFFGF